MATDSLDPAKGSGRPGSYKWHFLKVAELKTKQSVVDYTKEVTGKKLTFKAKTKLADLKAKAVLLIKDKIDDESK